jgi:hypothetical protein
VPKIDAGVDARHAGGAVDDTQIDPQRDARATFGDLRADEPRIEIVRPFDRLRRQEADIAKCAVRNRRRTRRTDPRTGRGYGQRRKNAARRDSIGVFGMVDFPKNCDDQA